MTTITFFPYAPLVIALVSIFGLAAVVLTDDDNPQVQANQDNIEFLISQAKSNMQTDITHEEAIMKQSIRSANNTDKIITLENYDKIITTQIGNIRSDIISKFPQASDVRDKEKTSIGTTPFLTLKMDKTDFVLGNVVIFTGTAQPNDSIQITLKLPDRSLIPIAVPRDKIIDATYMINYTLRLDDPVGIWQVYARQLSDQTKTITFTVE